MLDFLRNCTLDIVDFDGNKVCPLYDTYLDVENIATGISVTTQRNGWKTITFTINSPDKKLMENFVVDYIKPEYRIRIIEYKNTTTGSGSQASDTDYFILDKPKISHNNYSKTITVTASHCSAILKYRRLDLEFSDEKLNNTGTAEELLITILEGTGWSVGDVSQFYEKYDKTAVKKRSLKASKGTGAFNLIAKMCDLFEAKPVYHGDTKTVDILPLNPFSKDTIDPDTGLPDLSKAKNVIELYYSHNVKNISKTQNSENIVTKLYCYGSYGDTTKGYCSIYSLEHLEYTATATTAGDYYIVITNPFDTSQKYINFTAINPGELTFSCKDRTSMCYIYNEDEDEIYRTEISGTYSGTELTTTSQSVQNWTEYLLDFTYYIEEGLLTDDQLFQIAQYQRNYTDLVKQNYRANLQFNNDWTLVYNYIGGVDFVKLDIDHVAVESGNTVIYLTDDKVIYRTDYDEVPANYFDWYVAKKIKDNGLAQNDEASVIYVIHTSKTSGETYARTYIRAMEDKKLVLWKDVDFQTGDEAYLFQANCTSGKIGGLECGDFDDVNEISYYPAQTDIGNHPVYFEAMDSTPSAARLANFTEYGWDIVPHAADDVDSDVYFCYKSGGDTGWCKAILLDSVSTPSASAYDYYYDLKNLKLYHAVSGSWELFYDPDAAATEEWSIRKAIKEKFAQLKIYIDSHERAWKGYYEQYIYTAPTGGLAAGNYYYQDPYNNGFLFTTTKDLAAGDTLTIELGSSTSGTVNTIIPTYYSGTYTDILSGATWTAGYVDNAGIVIGESVTQEYSSTVSTNQDMMYNVSAACTLTWYNSSDIFVKQTKLSSAQSVIAPANAAKLIVTRTMGNTITMTTNGTMGDRISPAVVKMYDSTIKRHVKDVLDGVSWQEGSLSADGSEVETTAYERTTWLEAYPNTQYDCRHQLFLDTYTSSSWSITSQTTTQVVIKAIFDHKIIATDRVVTITPDIGGTMTVTSGQTSTEFYLNITVDNYTGDPSAITSITATGYATLVKGTDYKVCFYNSKSIYIGQVSINDNASAQDCSFTTPASTYYIRLVRDKRITWSMCGVYQYYNYVVYAKSSYNKKQYATLTPWVSAGELLGLYYLIKKFRTAADACYLTDRERLQTLEDEMNNAENQLTLSLGEIYKETTWQDTSYIEGHEKELFFDAIERLDEASHPQISYEIGYQDLYNTDLDESVHYPDIDINSALHILDDELDENLWAFVEQLTKCYDQPWNTSITVNTNLTTVANQTFTDVMTTFADVTAAVKASEGIVDSVAEVTSGKQLIADMIAGTIDAAKAEFNGAASSWYTDDRGNIIFEAANGSSAMKLCGNGFCVANKKDEFGDWMWSTFGNGEGFTADLITGGTIRGNLIEAGSITTDLVSSTFGNQLEIGSNKGLLLFATVDGTRPAGSVDAKREGVSFIQITPDGIEVWGGSSLNLESGSAVTVKGSDIDISGENSTTILSGGNMDINAVGDLNILGENVNIGSDTQTASINIKAAGVIKAETTDGSYTQIDQNGVEVKGRTIKLLNNSSTNGQIILGDEKNVFYSSGLLSLNNGSLLIDGSATGNGSITTQGNVNIIAGGNINLSTDTSAINMTAGSINMSGGTINATGGTITANGAAVDIKATSSLDIASPNFNVVSSTGAVEVGGTIYAKAGQIGCTITNDGSNATYTGGWYITSNAIYSGTASSDNYIELNSNNSSKNNWAIKVGGGDDPTSKTATNKAEFAVRRDGTTVISKLQRYKDEEQTELETIDLRASLWKMDHAYAHCIPTSTSGIEALHIDEDTTTGKYTLTLRDNFNNAYSVNFTSGGGLSIAWITGQTETAQAGLYTKSGALKDSISATLTVSGVMIGKTYIQSAALTASNPTRTIAEVDASLEEDDFKTILANVLTGRTLVTTGSTTNINANCIASFQYSTETTRNQIGFTTNETIATLDLSVSDPTITAGSGTGTMVVTSTAKVHPSVFPGLVAAQDSTEKTYNYTLTFDASSNALVTARVQCNGTNLSTKQTSIVSGNQSWDSSTQMLKGEVYLGTSSETYGKTTVKIPVTLALDTVSTTSKYAIDDTTVKYAVNKNITGDSYLYKATGNLAINPETTALTYLRKNTAYAATSVNGYTTVTTIDVTIQGEDASPTKLLMPNNSYTITNGYIRNNTAIIPEEKTLIGEACEIVSVDLRNNVKYTVGNATTAQGTAADADDVVVPDTTKPVVINATAKNICYTPHDSSEMTPISSSSLTLTKTTLYTGNPEKITPIGDPVTPSTTTAYLRNTSALYFNPVTRYSSTSAGTILTDITAVSNTCYLPSSSGINVKICSTGTILVDPSSKSVTGTKVYPRAGASESEAYTVYDVGSSGTWYNGGTKYSGGYYSSKNSKAYTITTGGTQYYAPSSTEVYYSSTQPYTGTVTTDKYYATNGATYYDKGTSKATSGYEVYTSAGSATYYDVGSADTLYKAGEEITRYTLSSKTAYITDDEGTTYYKPGTAAQYIQYDGTLYEPSSDTYGITANSNVGVTAYQTKTDSSTYCKVADKYNAGTATVYPVTRSDSGEVAGGEQLYTSKASNILVAPAPSGKTAGQYLYADGDTVGAVSDSYVGKNLYESADDTQRKYVSSATASEISAKVLYDTEYDEEHYTTVANHYEAGSSQKYYPSVLQLYKEDSENQITVLKNGEAYAPSGINYYQNDRTAYMVEGEQNEQFYHASEDEYRAFELAAPNRLYAASEDTYPVLFDTAQTGSTEYYQKGDEVSVVDTTKQLYTLKD